MFREYPFGYSETLVEGPPSPELATLAASGTRLAAWLHTSHDQQGEGDASA